MGHSVRKLAKQGSQSKAQFEQREVVEVEAGSVSQAGSINILPYRSAGSPSPPGTMTSISPPGTMTSIGGPSPPGSMSSMGAPARLVQSYGGSLLTTYGSPPGSNTSPTPQVYTSPRL